MPQKGKLITTDEAIVMATEEIKNMDGRSIAELLNILIEDGQKVSYLSDGMFLITQLKKESN